VRRSVENEDDHERAFVARYENLRAFARRFAGRERSLADDLLQDAFIHFTLARPSLDRIRNLDAYLATLLRNLYISWVRHAAAHRAWQVAIEDYDSAALALALSRVEDQEHTRRVLARVCEFVCHRKDTSKAAGVLILRFFHGFYPAEIASILRSTPRVVNDWLWKARQELRTFLDDPVRLPRAAAKITDGDDEAGDLVSRLQTAIFSTSQPPCLSSADVGRLYAGTTARTLDLPVFSHLAGCRPCLDRVCGRLGLATMSERNSDGGDDDEGGSASSPAQRLFEKRARKRARDVREHRPRQLHISVNGHHVGVLCVESARNEVRWSVRLDEPIGFAEAYSEQGLRMALLHVELPPDGDLIQRMRSELSDGRHLDLAVDFSEATPIMWVEYSDPSLLPAVRPQVDDDTLTRLVEVRRDEDTPPVVPPVPWWRAFRHAWLHRLLPGTSVLILVAVVGWWRVGRSADPAPESLIDDAAAVEAATVPPPGHVVHRTLAFELRRADSRDASFSHRIDEWNDVEGSNRVVRVVDQTGHLLSEERQTRGGSNVIELGQFDDVWRTGLSAVSFRDRYGSIGPCTTSAQSTVFTVTCARASGNAVIDIVIPALHAQASQPSRAVLMLHRPHLHAFRLELTVSLQGIDHIVSLEERTTATVRVADLPPDIFALDRPGSSASMVILEPSAPTWPATRSLEVRLLDLVDRLDAREFLTVRRTNADGLVVSGLVSSSRHRLDLLNGIRAFEGGADRVTVDVQTFDEARGRVAGREGTAAVRLLEAPVGTAPFERYLRSRFSSEVNVSAVVSELTPRALAAAGAMRRGAVALDEIANRFDERAVGDFDDEARAAWVALLGRHVSECLAALDTLDRMLAPYFAAAEGVSPQAPTTLGTAAGRLATDAATIDRAIGAVLTASDESVSASRLASALDVRQHIRRARMDTEFIQTLIRP
jgi:RNA polymerase sigma factor (sigma-70 family)